VINKKITPDEVFVSPMTVARTNLKPMDLKHFGTQHRSVFAYFIPGMISSTNRALVPTNFRISSKEKMLKAPLSHSTSD